MLVLTRKSNQSIMIGDDIEVSVLSIMGEKVRIGIQAPRDIPVFRKEVYLEIQQENVAAGASARAEVDDALKRLSTNNQRYRHRLRRGPARGSAEQVVQRLEHRDRHDDRGAQQHEHEQEEAHRAVAMACGRAWRSSSRRSARRRSFSRRSRSSSISSKKASSISAMLWRMRMGREI